MMSLKRIVAAVLLIAVCSLPAFAGPSVARKVFALDVVGREPVAVAETFATDVGTVYFFTQIIEIGEPTTINHVWLYDGKQVANVALNIEGTSWRTWTSKKIMAHQTGQWTVEVRDGEGNTFDSATFTVGQ
jgi:hypothetical protein